MRSIRARGRGLRRFGAAACAIAAASVAVLSTSVAPAGAHPLGNFTVNRYARVEVSAGAVRVRYVLDAAELPAFQLRQELAAGADRFADVRSTAIAADLVLTVGDVRLPLRPIAHDLKQPEGQGGLRTLRLDVVYEADLPKMPRGQQLRATLEDRNEPNRVGWREMVVTARGDARLLGSDVPAADISDELRSYPDDLLQTPLDRRRALFTFDPGTRSAPAPDVAPAAKDAAAVPPAGDRFVALLGSTAPRPAGLVGLLLVALAVGCVHALGPGHGKTVMAAYLAGTSGRARDAVALGGVVSLMHTASVLALAAVLAWAGSTTTSERAYPMLTVASGAAVIAIGGVLLARRGRAAAAHRRAHHHDDHAHTHAHAHTPEGTEGHHHHHGGPGGHTHDLPADVRPLSWKGIVALGAAGGLFPSPSAVVVLVSAFSLGRAGLGLGLVAAFSVGLAATLTVVGLALVRGRDVLTRRSNGRLVPLLPTLGAAALVLSGVVAVVRGVGDLV